MSKGSGSVTNDVTNTAKKEKEIREWKMGN